jgi:hypothetical protein
MNERILLITNIDLIYLDNNNFNFYKYLAEIIQHKIFYKNKIIDKDLILNDTLYVNLDILSFRNVETKTFQLIENICNNFINNNFTNLDKTNKNLINNLSKKNDNIKIKLKIKIINLDDYLSNNSNILNNSNKNILNNLSTIELYKKCEIYHNNINRNISNSKYKILYQQLIFSLIKFLLNNNYDNIIFEDMKLYRWIFDLSINNLDFKNNFMIFNNKIIILLFENINYCYENINYCYENNIYKNNIYENNIYENNIYENNIKNNYKETINSLSDIINFFTNSVKYVYKYIFTICQKVNYLKYELNVQSVYFKYNTKDFIYIVEYLDLQNYFNNYLNVEKYKEHLDLIYAINNSSISSLENIIYKNYEKEINLCCGIHLDTFFNSSDNNNFNNKDIDITNFINILKYNITKIISLIAYYYLLPILYFKNKSNNNTFFNNNHYKIKKINIVFYIINSNNNNYKILYNEFLENLNTYLNYFTKLFILDGLCIDININIKNIEELYIYDISYDSLYDISYYFKNNDLIINYDYIDNKINLNDFTKFNNNINNFYQPNNLFTLDSIRQFIDFNPSIKNKITLSQYNNMLTYLTNNISKWYYNFFKIFIKVNN